MSTDWWSPGQRWLEQEASKEAASQKRDWVKRGRSSKTFRYNPPEWHRDAVAALGRNDEETFKAIKLSQLGTRGLPLLPKRHHAAKKSPAQLEREINEALNRKVDRGTVEEVVHPYEGMRVLVTKYGAWHHGLRAGARGVIKRVASPDARLGLPTSRASVLVNVHGDEFSTQWPTAALRVVK